MNERFQTVARTLRREIVGGRYQPRAVLPSRHELARRFAVTRSTIDRSIAALVREGLLISRQGAPTCVNSQKRGYSLAFVGRMGDCNSSLAQKNFKIHYYSCRDLKAKSNRQQLRGHDGIVWHLPEDETREWIAELNGRLPQIVVNRSWPDFNYVSTDHKEAIYRITLARLKAAPQALPYFLVGNPRANPSVLHMRQEGFVKACRKTNLFYEIVELPESFEEKIEFLEQRIIRHDRRPLVLVADQVRSTGAVIRWIQTKGWRWKRNVFYSDFDNNLEPCIWGLRVTSYVQDYQGLVALALDYMPSLIEGRTDCVQKLVFPRLIEGDT